jgi:hypothetical protein
MKQIGRKFGVAPFLFAFGIAVGASLTGTAWAIQGHMWNALNDLNAASSQLNAALPDKAGHRVNAINLVNQAIGEVKAGIAAGR